MNGLFGAFQRPMQGGRGFFGLGQPQPIPQGPPTMMPQIAPPAPGAQQVPMPPMQPGGFGAGGPAVLPPAPNAGLGQGVDGAPNADPRKMQYFQNRMNLGFGRGVQPGGGMVY